MDPWASRQREHDAARQRGGLAPIGRVDVAAMRAARGPVDDPRGQVFTRAPPALAPPPEHGEGLPPDDSRGRTISEAFGREGAMGAAQAIIDLLDAHPPVDHRAAHQAAERARKAAAGAREAKRQAVKFPAGAPLPAGPTEA